jgi:hypothetical protein
MNMIPKYESFSTRINTLQACEMIKHGTMSPEWTWHSEWRWKHVTDKFTPDSKCAHCGFLTFGYTDIEQLEKGVEASQPCRSIVLDAVQAWHQSEVKSLDGVYVFAWTLGYIGIDVSEEKISGSVVLRWPHEECWTGDRDPPWTPSHDRTINIFKAGM